MTLFVALYKSASALQMCSWHAAPQAPPVTPGHAAAVPFAGAAAMLGDMIHISNNEHAANTAAAAPAARILEAFTGHNSGASASLETVESTAPICNASAAKNGENKEISDLPCRIKGQTHCDTVLKKSQVVIVAWHKIRGQIESTDTKLTQTLSAYCPKTDRNISQACMRT